MRARLLTAVALLSTPLGVAAQNSITRWQPIAESMVRRFALGRGERVLLVGEAGKADSLVPYLRAAIVGAGATDLGAISVRAPWPGDWDTDFVQKLRMARASDMPDLLDEVDLAVMLPGPQPTDPLYASIQEKLRSGEGRTVHFHWQGAYRLDGVPFEPTPAVDAWYARVLLDTDYAALAERQRAFEAAMRTGEVRVTTPGGTDLRFRIGDRPVTRQDGDASAARAAQARNLIDREVELPAGAIRVAPLEESVEGVIAFPPGVWGGVPVEGLRMHFSRGRVTRVEAATGRDGVERELASGGESARAFREFALGFNPLLAIRNDGAGPWIPYYGYGSGIVRLSLGDNTELGGAVGGGYIRWNFFTDATVSVGGTPWPVTP
jgi:hypothetical protein